MSGVLMLRQNAPMAMVEEALVFHCFLEEDPDKFIS